MSYYLPDFPYKIKENIDYELEEIYRQFLDINSIILDKPIPKGHILIPMKASMCKSIFTDYLEAKKCISEMFKANDIYNIDLDLFKAIESANLIINDEYYGCPVDEKYTRAFLETNICNFSLNWTNGLVEYREEPYTSNNALKEVLGNGCTDMVGDANDRIADIFKMMEVILLYISGKLSPDEKLKMDTILNNMTRDKLVVDKKYSNVSDFLDKFIQRQETVRKIMDRKIEQYEKKEQTENEN